MQRRDPLVVSRHRVRAQGQQQGHGRGVAVLGGGQQRARRAHDRRLGGDQRASPRRVTGGGQGLQGVGPRQGRGRRAMGFQQFSQGREARQPRDGQHRPLLIGVRRVGVGAALQQPLRAADMVLADGVAQQVVQRRAAQVLAQPVGTLHAPVVELSGGLGLAPQHVVPVGVVADDRDVVERLGVVGVGPERHQQRDQGLGLRMAGLGAFAQADRAGQHLERGLPVVGEAEVRIGSGLQQTARHGQAVRVVEAAIGHVGQGGPAARGVYAPNGVRIARQMALDGLQIATGGRREQAVAGQVRMALEDAAGDGRLAVPAVAQDLLEPLATALAFDGQVVDRGLQGDPAFLAIFQGHGVLDVAQSRFGGCVGPSRREACSSGNVARPQGFQPPLGVLAQGFDVRLGRELTAHGKPSFQWPNVRLRKAGRRLVRYLEGQAGWEDLPCRGQAALQKRAEAIKSSARPIRQPTRFMLMIFTAGFRIWPFIDGTLVGPSVRPARIFFTTSMPCTTLPNTA